MTTPGQFSRTFFRRFQDEAQRFLMDLPRRVSGLLRASHPRGIRDLYPVVVSLVVLIGAGHGVSHAATGSISASPNPIQACDGLGVTTLTWTSTAGLVEVHVNSPAGPLFSQSGSGTASSTTGKWVVDGTVFYLQDVSGGLPLTSANTLATVTVTLTTNGCPAATFSANPNPITVCDGVGFGVTTLTGRRPRRQCRYVSIRRPARSSGPLVQAHGLGRPENGSRTGWSSICKTYQMGCPSSPRIPLRP